MKLESEDILKELEAKVEVSRKEYEEAKSALTVFQRLFSTQKESIKQKPEKAIADVIVNEEGEFNLSAFNLPDNSKPSLSQNILELLSKFGSQEFTVGHIMLVLESQGGVPDVKSPKASIAQALSVLEKKGCVIRTFRGTGNVPHKFKVSDKILKKHNDSYEKEKTQ